MSVSVPKYCDIVQNFLKVDEEMVGKVRAFYEVDEGIVKEKVDTIVKWAKSQPCLPLESQDESFVESMLLRNKFDSKRTQFKIEKYFKAICCYPEIFSNVGRVKSTQEVGIVVTTPLLTPNLTRIGILKLAPNTSSEDFDADRCSLLAVTVGMVIFHMDYGSGVHFILDFEGFTYQHLTKVKVPLLLKLLAIYENVLSIRVVGIEIINAPTLVSALLKLAKMVMKPKLFSRISVHNNLESLYKNIPKESLPSDYSGNCKSIQDLREIWDHIIENNQPFYRKFIDIVEASYENSNDFIFSVQGSFKTLNID